MIALCIALASGATLAKSTRVDVLHKPDTAAERVITISVSALPAHCRHGDTYPDGAPLECGNDGVGGGEETDICHVFSLIKTGGTDLSLTEDGLKEHEADFTHDNADSFNDYDADSFDVNGSCSDFFGVVSA